MKLEHFEALRPACTVCLQAGAGVSPMEVDQVFQRDGHTLLEGTLRCTSCGRELPLIDGIPLMVPHLRDFVSSNLLHLLGRDDLSPLLESVVGDCCGPGSAYDAARQRRSTYGRGHYGDLDPERRDAGDGSLIGLLEPGLQLLAQQGTLPDGPVVDLGCGPGRSSFELAERLTRQVVGIDLDVGLLRLAARVLRTGEARYQLRRVGLVYEERRYPVSFPQHRLVDFWCADAGALPLAEPRFALAVSLNLLDCLPDPRAHLASLGRMLQPGGYALIACPFDWGGATPLEGWLGGHCQRGSEGGSSEQVLRLLLTPGAHPCSLHGLEMLGEVGAVPWTVRMHDRSRITYDVHVVVARATGTPDPF